MLSSRTADLLRHVRSGRAIPLSPRQLGAPLPSDYRLYLDSSAKTAVLTCLRQRPFLKRHADAVISALEPLRTKSIVNRFVLAVPSDVGVSSDVRRSFARFGGEICERNSAGNLRELTVLCGKDENSGAAASVLETLYENSYEDKNLKGTSLLPEDPIQPCESTRRIRRPRLRRRRKFELCANHVPTGDQPKAIKFLVDGILDKRKRFQTLHGVTGSGKTFMMANIIAQLNQPALILAPNKTLAAQLYNEFSRCFPKNRVEFFVSHFKFYQPEAYLPNSDKYIAKSSAVDHEIDRLRHAATKSIFERNDTIVVASVSSIYGLGLPTEYLDSAIDVQIGDQIDIEEFADKLRSLNYVEDEDKVETSRGLFSKGQDFVQVSPPWEREGTMYRYSFQDRVVVKLQKVDIVDDTIIDLGDDLVLYPANHFVTPRNRLETAIQRIEEETRLCVERFEKEGKMLEASRLQDRVTADVDMMKKIGFCQGAENYSLYLSDRKIEEPPETFLDYMPRDESWLLFVDESHVTVPQLRGMHAGNAARKRKLIEYGFRLPSSLENRPLNQDEFWSKTDKTIFVSATPGPFESGKSGSEGIVEAVIRPTAVVDPTVEVIDTTGQLEHLTRALANVAAEGGRAIVTTITKKFAEDVADCLSQKPPVAGILDRQLNVSFLHSGIDSVGRMEVLEAMRDESSDKADRKVDKNNGKKLDVVVGVNLLREGIDLPSVRLVAILDADAEGFLRGETALIQTIGRAARNVNGHVVMYANTVTSAMRRAIYETNRRRRLQMAYNRTFNVEAVSVAGVFDTVELQEKGDPLLDRIRGLKLQSGQTVNKRDFHDKEVESSRVLSQASHYELLGERPTDLTALRKRMLDAANSHDFEAAALLRDQLALLERSVDKIN